MITILFGLFALVILTLAGLLFMGYYPKKIQPEPITQLNSAPLLSNKKKFKILSYNIQFMAGKDYTFWFDVPDRNGPDESPSLDAVKKTTTQVANIIIDEEADFIFLQEVDDGAKRTNKQDQLNALLDLLPNSYTHHTSAFYWQSAFVPHPRIWGCTGMKLSILSKHPIAISKRHQLPIAPNNILTKHLRIKRAVLEARIPFEEGGELILLNTHLEAFSKQSDTLQKQVDYVGELLTTFNQQNLPWIIGGDFNLLPPNQFQTLATREQFYYRATSELRDLTHQFSCIPSIEDIEKDPTTWYSFYSNDPKVLKPDRTIDYLFYSPLLQCLNKTIRQHDTISISDHFPVIASFGRQTYTVPPQH